MDWYDSHCDKEALITLKADANTISLFTENGCPDILAAPDDGLIKTLMTEFRRILDSISLIIMIGGSLPSVQMLLSGEV